MYEVPIGAWAKMTRFWEPENPVEVQFMGYTGGTIIVRFRNGEEESIDTDLVDDGKVTFSPPLAKRQFEPVRYPWWVKAILIALVLWFVGKVGYNVGVDHGQKEETRVHTITLEDPEREALEAEIARLSAGVEPLMQCAQAFGVSEDDIMEYFRDDFIARFGADR